MKKLKLVLTLILLLTQVKAYSQCPSIQPFINGGNIFTIDRYLARSIKAYELASLKMSNPSGFNNEVNFLVSMRPTLVNLVATVYTNESKMIVGAPYHTAAQQSVADINAAFDCAGIPRPLILASVYEVISNDVNNVPIPTYVLQAFSASDPDFATSGYSVSGTYNFNIANIAYTSPVPGVPWATTPDITRIEARMWYYYLYTQFINMGYLAMSAGWMDLYTKHDQPNYHKMALLLRMVRDYATNQGTFVVISGDSYDVYEGGTNNLLFDFNGRPIRFDEVHPHSSGTPCANEPYPADLNAFRFHSQHMKSGGGGAPPMAVAQGTGYTYDKTPTMFGFDWTFTTWLTKNVPNHQGFPWGWDETSWLDNVLTTDECRAYVVMNAACATKNDLFYRGYFEMPGRVIVLQPYGTGIYKNLISSNPVLENGILNDTWKPNNDLHFTITPVCDNCNQETTYRCNVTNPDCSSVYQWHVFYASGGTYLPMHYGREMILKGLAPGTYHIGLVQNNLGMDQDAVIVHPGRELEVVPGEEGPCIGEGEGKKMLGNTSDISSELAGATLEQYYKNPPVQYTNITRSTDKAQNNINLQGSKMSIYPNPAKDVVNITVHLLADEVISIYVTNAVGEEKLVVTENNRMRKGDNTLLKSVSSLTPGVYYVQVKGGSFAFTEKLVVVK